MFGEDGLKNGGGGGADDDDGGDDDFFRGLFNSGFGVCRRRRKEGRVPDDIISFPVSVDSLYNGGVVEAVHKRRVICNSWSDCESKCSRCGGSGIIIQTHRIGPGFVEEMQTTCPKCGVKAKIGVTNCKKCPDGQFEEVEKYLFIDIERGMADSNFISFDGQTDEAPYHVNGDVKFQIVSIPHSRFSGVKNDLHYTVRVTLSEALVGVNRQVRQLDNRIIPIKKNKIISSGKHIIIGGEGMPSVDGGEDGDIVVTFWVDFPNNMMEEQRKAVIDLHGQLPTLEETGDGTPAQAAGVATETKSEL